MTGENMANVTVRVLPIAAAALLAFSGPALAQKKKGGGKEGSGETDAAKEAARKHFKQGVEHFKNEDYTKALQSFLASDELFHHPKTMLNIANCYEKLFEVPDAMKYYTLYLEEGGSEVTAAEKKEIDGKMDRMKDKVGKIEVDGSVKGELIVDGKSVAQLPTSDKLFFYAGNHSVVIKSEGKIVLSEDLKLKGAEVRQIKVEAKPQPKDTIEPVAPLEGKGKNAGKDAEGKEGGKEALRGILHISSTIEGSDIVVNNKSVGVTPWEEELKVGAYDVQVSHEGLKTWKKLVDVQSEKTTLVDVDLAATKKRPAPWFWITAGAAVVFGSLWAGFGLDGIQARKDAKELDPEKNAQCAAIPACYEKYNDLVDTSKKDFLIADIMGPLALVAIGGTVALALLVKKEKNVPKARVEISSLSPFVTRDGTAGGLGLGGNFSGSRKNNFPLLGADPSRPAVLLRPVTPRCRTTTPPS
jgi:hypothetical protein